MTKSESKRSGVSAGKCASAASAAEQVNNGSFDVGFPEPSPAAKAKVLKQTSKESLHRRNAECEVYDDGTNTFFWWVGDLRVSRPPTHGGGGGGPRVLFSNASRLSESQPQVTSVYSTTAKAELVGFLTQTHILHPSLPTSVPPCLPNTRWRWQTNKPEVLYCRWCSV